jgi:hypothetical protein
VAHARPGPAERGNRSQRELQELHEWVHSLEPEWWTTAITFQRGPEWVRFCGIRWRVQLSFFGTRWGWTRSSHIRYSVSISISSGGDLTPKQRLALSQTHSLRDVAAVLGNLGYRGKWHPKEYFGHFMKDLRTRVGLRQEMRNLEGISFKGLFGEVGRRTMR